MSINFFRCLEEPQNEYDGCLYIVQILYNYMYKYIHLAVRMKISWSTLNVEKSKEVTLIIED